MGTAAVEPCPPPLYPGAQITEKMGTMLILTIATKHRLTRSAISDILRVVSMHLPEGTNPKPYRSGFHFSYDHNITSRSLYHLFKRVNGSSSHSPAIVHRLCGKCQGSLNGQECSNSGCWDITEPVMDDTFLELPVDEQVKEMF